MLNTLRRLPLSPLLVLLLAVSTLLPASCAEAPSNGSADDAAASSDVIRDRGGKTDSAADSADEGDAPDTTDDGTVAVDGDTAPDVTADAGPDTRPDLGPAQCPAPPDNLPNVNFTTDGRYRRLQGLEYPGLAAHDLTILLPAAYDSDSTTRYPVLYMHDAQNLFDPREAAFGVAWEVDATLDALTDAGVVPPTIVVGIANNNDRIPEYTPDEDPRYPGSGRGADYEAFIVDLVKPLVDADFRTLCDASHTTMVGSSLGGLISFDMALRHPGVFDRIGAVSPSFWWHNGSELTAFGSYDGPLPERLWIDGGTAEETERDSQGLNQMVANARHMRDLALARGMVLGDDLGYLEIPGATHDEASWAARLDSILTYLLADAPPGSGSASSLSLQALTPVLSLDNGPTVTNLLADADFNGLTLTVPNQELTFASDPAGVVSIASGGTITAQSGGLVEVRATDSTLEASEHLLVVQNGMAPVVFEVTVPSTTPTGDTVYIAGDRAELGAWAADGVALQHVDGDLWRGQVVMPYDTAFQFKVTRGSWDTVEKTAGGSEINNRTGRSNGNLPVAVTVAAWADDFSN